MEGQGDIQKRLSESYKEYQALVEQKKTQGVRPPLGEGVLIFDEVKVAMKVHGTAEMKSCLVSL